VNPPTVEDQQTAPALPWDGVARGYVPPKELSIDPSLRLHRDAAEEIDPITYEVVRYALLNINLEHGALLQRLCVSPVTMLTRDFQASILSEDGDVVYFGPDVQYFSMAHALTVKWTLENRSTSPGIAPGDMFLSNDPFVGAPHQSDTAVIAPVFIDGELFCWVANIIHHVDLGGTQPGSFCLDAEDIWSEPTPFPPVKLVSGGDVNTDVEELFVRQSRFPANVRMDLRASISANLVSCEKILTLVDRYGAEVVKGAMYRTLDASERTFVERLDEIPDGKWSHRSYTEVAVPGDRGVYRYQVNIEKVGDRLIVDNEGTEPQAGSINCPFVAFAGAVLAALTAQLASDLAGAFGGIQRRVEFRPVPGTLSCADYPAPVSPSGALTNHLVVSAATTAVGKMMLCGSEEIRARTLGPSMPHWYSIIYSGLTEAGMPYVMLNINGMMGSPGGMPGRDGPDAGGHHSIPAGIAFNIEEVERQYPVLYLYRRYLPEGADGAGTFRGGLGFAEAGVPWGATTTMMHLQMNEAFPKAQGLMGGNPDSRARFALVRGSGTGERFAQGEVPQDVGALGEAEHPRFKDLNIAVAAEDAWEWTSPTAAGYGEPLLRDPQLVFDEVAGGHLAAAAAERVYGLVTDDDGLDPAATDELRRLRCRERLDAATAPPSPVAGEPNPDATFAIRIGEVLGVAESNGHRHFGCQQCGRSLGPVDANYRDACALLETPIASVAPEFAAEDVEIAAKIVHREYLCPSCGLRCDAEIARVDDPPLFDLSLRG
jgi:N-methylhydantoinase B